MTMTRQEVFTKVADHLLTQGQMSQEMFLNGTCCAYRGSGGFKCAAGILILDAFYLKNLERRKVWDTDVSHALRCSGVDFDDLDLVGDLQDIHDSTSTTPDMWRNKLREVAELHGLQMVPREPHHKV